MLRTIKASILIFIISNLFLFNIDAQKIEITQSDFNFNYSSTSLHKIVSHDKDFYYVVKHQANRYFIEKLDKNLNLVISKPVKLHDGLKTFTLASVVHFYDELYLFITKRRISDIVLYYQKLDKETLLPKTERIEIATFAFVKGNWPDFNFALSRNETKLLIASRIKLHWSKEQYDEYFIYGKKFNLLWTKKRFSEFEGQGTRETEYYVDDFGNVTVFGLIRRENILTLFDEVKNIYTIARYTDNGETFNEYPITLQNRYIRGIKVVSAENGDLICAGLYSEAFFEGAKGVFFFKIRAADGRIIWDYTHKYSKEFIDEISENNESIIQENELYKYIVNDLILRKNGKVIMIAEQFYTQTYETYNSLIVTCFDVGGKFYWSQIIKKKQNFNINQLKENYGMPQNNRYYDAAYDIKDNYVIEPELYRDYIINTGEIDTKIENYSSYALLAPIDDDDIMIFYNDNIKNIKDSKVNKSFGNPKRSYIVAVHIDQFGNVTKQNLLPWKRKMLYPVPIRYYHNKKNTIIIPAYKGRKYNYYKFKVDFDKK